ncbi:MAG: hypothetical protein Q8S13_06530 [Dehalococcoidia bacterium]|nr:hypothetical protein [Dehalococcoidia bacterium]
MRRVPPSYVQPLGRQDWYAKREDRTAGLAMDLAWRNANTVCRQTRRPVGALVCTGRDPDYKLTTSFATYARFHVHVGKSVADTYMGYAMLSQSGGVPAAGSVEMHLRIETEAGVSGSIGTPTTYPVPLPFNNAGQQSTDIDPLMSMHSGILAHVTLSARADYAITGDEAVILVRGRIVPPAGWPTYDIYLASLTLWETDTYL